MRKAFHIRLIMSAFISLLVKDSIAQIRCNFFDPYGDFTTTDIKYNFYSKNDNVISTWILNQKTNKIKGELIKNTDSTFYYFQFDSLGKKTADGILLIDSLNYDTAVFSIPDCAKDPDGSKGIMKDTTLKHYYFVKDNFWREKDSLGYFWKGNYKKGCRVGYWDKGIYKKQGWAIEYRFVNIARQKYFNGIVDSSSISEFINFPWLKLQGKWYYLDTARSDPLFLSRQKKSGFFINFISEEKYQWNCTSTRAGNNLKLCVDSWDSYKGTINLYLHEGNKPIIYGVIEITDNHLTLRKGGDILKNTLSLEFQIPD